MKIPITTLRNTSPVAENGGSEIAASGPVTIDGLRVLEIGKVHVTMTAHGEIGSQVSMITSGKLLTLLVHPRTRAAAVMVRRQRRGGRDSAQTMLA